MIVPLLVQLGFQGHCGAFVGRKNGERKTDRLQQQRGDETENRRAKQPARPPTLSRSVVLQVMMRIHVSSADTSSLVP